jgi:hypothetical protein
MGEPNHGNNAAPGQREISVETCEVPSQILDSGGGLVTCKS